MRELVSSLSRVVPFYFCVGAAMELFMVKTGFYEIVTRKEGERRAEALAEQERQLRRMRELNIKVGGVGAGQAIGNSSNSNSSNSNSSSNGGNSSR